MGGGEDEAASSAIGMAEEQLAQTLAAQGGLGLTAMVMQGLAHDEDQRRAKGSEHTGNSAPPGYNLLPTSFVRTSRRPG